METNKGRKFVVTANFIKQVQDKQKATQEDLKQLAERINKMYIDFLIELEKIN